MEEVPGTSTVAAAAAPRDSNEALHKAIEKGDLEKFLGLLHQLGVDVNCECRLQTPLTLSIENHNSRMTKKIIETGCDVNLRNVGDFSPLHLALEEANRERYVDVALVEMLLHKGADPNAKFYWNWCTPTALLYAIRYDCRPSNNLEVTSILLYYGADVNITSGDNETPLQMAIHCRENSCAEVLLNYYDDFSNRNNLGNGDTVLHYAIAYESPLVPALLERGADVNALDAYGNCILDQTLRNRNMETFKYIWSKINHQLLMNLNSNFLLEYVQKSKFSNSEYLECLYLILESPIAQGLIDRSVHGKLLSILLRTFKSRKMSPKERLFAIYTCVSFGIKIETKDLLCVIKNYGFNEEFKALLYVGDFNCCDCIEQIKYFKQWKEDFYLKGFSSLSFENKQHAEAVNELLATSSRLQSKRMLEALRKVPEFPSLLELSRNKAQKFIEQAFSLTKLYHFYDAVAFLKLPQLLKDVILLEKPIYDDVTIIK